MKNFVSISKKDKEILAERVGAQGADFIADFIGFWNCELVLDGEKWRIKKHFGVNEKFVCYDDVWSWDDVDDKFIYKIFKKLWGAFVKDVINEHGEKLSSERDIVAAFFDDFRLAFELLIDDIQPGFTREVF